MMQPSFVSFASILFVSFGLEAMAAEDVAGRQFFTEQVYPLLKEHCFKCHGGGDELKGDFRITSREGLLVGGHFGSALEENDPAASVLLEMVSYKDADHQMPPKKQLSEEAISLLKKWMELGAPYDPALEIHGEAAPKRGFSLSDQDRQWWAYRAISGAAPPTGTDADWQSNGIDAFVRVQLEQKGLTPNPPASPHVLVRRLFYDLIGLPPTPREVESFVLHSQKNPEKAYHDLVEDLLARPQYGEKWARHWLDLVRYAETNGFERDNTKPEIWRYRDYVIDSFNSNRPYDQFVIEQLAGDEIETPTRDSLVATGYHRLMQWDDEPADREQHVYDVLADDVQITSETFLASSLGCARCHDHKADPISQRDYYSFMSFFKGVTHYTTEGTILHWSTPEARISFETDRSEKVKTLEAKSSDLNREIQKVVDQVGFATGKGGDASPPLLDDARGKGAEWFYTEKTPGPEWRDVGFVNKSWFKGWSGFGAGNPPGSVIKTKWATPDIWMRTTFGLTALPASLVLEIHHDEDVEVFLNGIAVFQAKGFTKGYEIVDLPKAALDALQTGKNVVAVHCHQSGGGQYIDLSLRTSASGNRNLNSLLSGPGSREFSNKVRKQTGKNLVDELKKVSDEISSLRKAEAGTAINAVTERGADPGPMFIHLRGSAHAEGDAVVPGFPAVLASEGAEPRPALATPVVRDGRTTSGRRIELAKWIVDPANPLTARVMVNRLWQHHFGRGIVPSSSDFGHLGEKPTHPELLDWLASEFQKSGWDIKKMHRLILESRTYQMSSDPDSANLEKDPENRNFWRYDMRRLTAEELRDSILAVSGNLNLQSFGEWVFPPLPAEVLATASRPGAGWPVSPKAEDHFRRSLYVHVKRSLRHQMLADFDQADTDTTCAVRFATTVPTQALTMLNSGFVNTQALVFASRMRKSGSEVRAQIAHGIELALQRDARAEELDHLVTFYEILKKESGLTDAQALDRVALLTLNLNEFVYLD